MIFPMEKDTKSNQALKDKATAKFMELTRYVRFVAYEKAPSRDLVGDIVNDVFIYFVEHADRWDYTRDLRPVIKGVTHNIALQHWRKYTQMLPKTLSEIAGFLIRNENGSEEDESVSHKELEETALELCMAKLSPQHRQILVAFYYRRMKLSEIAQEMHIKLGTLQKMICRIRIVLRECIEKAIQEGVLHVE
ncbi:MAG: sigma-70 family RNA polymerase sigma factor [Planctomycetia bacterium]|nr:sigma-70 family RNA polymerase sigma factor [Planctomycetia bacterium]